ncbi:MAG: RDD family protein [Candidatus Obscuribacterales bacterium]|nr:RDD family protein [Candidatus Obscuribacterales bacterium]
MTGQTYQVRVVISIRHMSTFKGLANRCGSDKFKTMSLQGLKGYLYGFSGLINVMLLRFGAAVSCLSRGIELVPDLPYNYSLRAYARLCLDDLEGAVEDCSSKLALVPNDAGALALRASAYYLLGHFELVIFDLERAFEIEPSRKWFQFDCLRLLDAYSELGDDRKIIDLISVTIKPKLERSLEVELLTRRARAYHNIGHDDQAILDYNSAIRRGSKSELVNLYSARARVYERLHLDDLSEKDRLSAAQIQAHKAQMTEWIPAKPQQRLLAQVLDGLVVGCLTAFLLYVAACTLDITNGGKAGPLSMQIMQWQLLILGGFAVAFLDALFVCVAPLLLIASIVAFVSTQALRSLDLNILGAPLAHPELSFGFLAALVILINWLYHSVMESSPRESTLGKAVVRLRVTDVDGGRLSFSRASLRHLLKVVASTIVITSVSGIAVLVCSHGAILLEAIVTLVSVFLLLIGLLALSSPGLHNCFASCLVIDNYLYAPKLRMLVEGSERDGG